MFLLFEGIIARCSGYVNVKYNKAAIKKFKVTLVPTLVFLDKEGTVIKKYQGLMKSDEIIEILDGIK